MEKISTAKDDKLIQTQMESKGNRTWRKILACIKLWHTNHQFLPTGLPVILTWLPNSQQGKQSLKQKNPPPQNSETMFNTFLSGLSGNIACETCSPTQKTFCHSCPPFKRSNKCLKQLPASCSCPDIRISCLLLEMT